MKRKRAGPSTSLRTNPPAGRAGFINIFILTVIFLSLGESVLAQTPTMEMTLTPTLTSTPSATPTSTPTLLPKPTSPTSEPSMTVSPTKIVISPKEVGCPPTAVPVNAKETPESGRKTLFWAIVVIAGAGILWVVGELMGPSTPLEASPPKKKDEGQDF